MINTNILRKKIAATLSICILCLFSSLAFTGCSSQTPKKQLTKFSEDFFTLSITEVKDTMDIDIEKLVESFIILPLDNDKEEALCSPLTMYITDKHIGINPSDRGGIYKLFAKDGRFLCNVGNVGQGPGEYTSVLYHQIDEKEKRIYLNTFTASKIMVYDFNGKYLNDIPLAYNLNKGSFKVDNEQKIVYCFDVPFEQNPFIWKQDFKGNVQGKVLRYPYSLRPDYSNDVHTLFNTDGFYTSVSTYFEQMNDTLYHYYPETDNLKPVFSVNLGEQKCTHSYINTPLNIYIGLSSGINKNNGPFSTAEYNLIKVDKKNHEAHYMRLFSQDYGNLPINLYYMQMRYGHIYVWMEPTQLMDALDKVLTHSDLKPEVRNRVTKLRNNLHENGNNVLLFGKLKQQ